MSNRFEKIDYAEHYAVKDNQINGLPLIRSQYSDESFILTNFLNELHDENENLRNLIGHIVRNFYEFSEQFERNSDEFQLLNELSEKLGFIEIKAKDDEWL